MLLGNHPADMRILVLAAQLRLISMYAEEVCKV